MNKQTACTNFLLSLSDERFKKYIQSVTLMREVNDLDNAPPKPHKPGSMPGPVPPRS